MCDGVVLPQQLMPAGNMALIAVLCEACEDRNLEVAERRHPQAEIDNAPQMLLHHRLHQLQNYISRQNQHR